MCVCSGKIGRTVIKNVQMVMLQCMLRFENQSSVQTIFKRHIHLKLARYHRMVHSSLDAFVVDAPNSGHVVAFSHNFLSTTLVEKYAIGIGRLLAMVKWKRGSTIQNWL